MHPTISDFLESLRSEGKSEKTIDTYRLVLGGFIKWYEDSTGESFQPKDVTDLDTANYKRYLLNHAKPATINKARITLKRYFDWLVNREIIKESPMEGIRPVKQGRKAPRWLDRKEQLALLRAVKKDGKRRDIAIIQLLLHAGLRVEELCNLRLEDVELSERKGKVIVRQGKGEKWREVPLNRDARVALKKWLEDRRSDGPWLFTSSRSEQMTPRAVQLVVKKYGERAGLERCTPHTLRHTFCHELAVKGVPLDVIATLAGHMKSNGQPNISTTVIYTTPGDQDLRRAVDLLSWEA